MRSAGSARRLPALLGGGHRRETGRFLCKLPVRRRGARGDKMLIGVPLETAAGETRVAVTPETAKKLKAQGHTVRVQSGAGVAASATDEAYVAAGAEITDRAGAFGSELVLKVKSP